MNGTKELCLDILTYEHVKVMGLLYNASPEAHDEACQYLDLVDEDEELYSTRITIKSLDDLYYVMSFLKNVDCHLQLRYAHRSKKLSFDLEIHQNSTRRWSEGDVIREGVKIYEQNINAEMDNRMREAIKLLKGTGKRC